MWLRIGFLAASVALAAAGQPAAELHCARLNQPCSDYVPCGESEWTCSGSCVYRDSAVEPTAQGWDPIDAAGIHRHAAIGLFDTASSASSPLETVQARVNKSPSNPLFNQDKDWETRIDNGYPNVVYDPDSAARGDGPWRLWYGNIGTGGQYLLYANSTDGLTWQKPNLLRYDLADRWPHLAHIGKNNNIVMFGGGLGMYRDLHETDPKLRYKISGGAPAGCYDATGNKDCKVATAGSPDGISRWTDVQPLTFKPPWRPDCHTNLFWDEPLQQYLMTTRSYEDPEGRDISIARTSKGGPNATLPPVFKKNGTWSLRNSGVYPPTAQDSGCAEGDPGSPSPVQAVQACGAKCLASADCRFFWVYTKGEAAGKCCLKTAIEPGPLKKPGCASCGGEFYSMGGTETKNNATGFDAWEEPVIVERGVAAHQLYSQITWRFFDVFLGIVMTFDAENGSVGPAAGHVHCMLSWSKDGLDWQWVDRKGGLEALKEFIPAGEIGSFESHVCFAAHTPLKMPDGTTRLYYMGGNGPHSGKRNSSFALATLEPDRFAGVAPAGDGRGSGGSGDAGQQPAWATATQSVTVTGATMIVTVDIEGSADQVQMGIEGQAGFGASEPISRASTADSTTDVAVRFPGQPAAGLKALIGKQVKIKVGLTRGATLYTVGFK